jgi:hypothetical protein
MTTQHWSELITRPKKKNSVRGGHVITVKMPPRIARHSEKGDDHFH